MSKKTVCDRCGNDVKDRLKHKDRLFPYTFTNCMGEEVKMRLCWDCDWEVMNGHDPFEDNYDIHMGRWEEEYAYDPINTPPPYIE